MKNGQNQLEKSLKVGKAVVLGSAKNTEPKKLTALEQIGNALANISKGIYLF